MMPSIAQKLAREWLRTVTPHSETEEALACELERLYALEVEQKLGNLPHLAKHENACVRSSALAMIDAIVGKKEIGDNE